MWLALFALRPLSFPSGEGKREGAVEGDARRGPWSTEGGQYVGGKEQELPHASSLVRQENVSPPRNFNVGRTTTRARPQEVKGLEERNLPHG